MDNSRGCRCLLDRLRRNQQTRPQVLRGVHGICCIMQPSSQNLLGAAPSASAAARLPAHEHRDKVMDLHIGKLMSVLGLSSQQLCRSAYEAT